MKLLRNEENTFNVRICFKNFFYFQLTSYTSESRKGNCVVIIMAFVSSEIHHTLRKAILFSPAELITAVGFTVVVIGHHFPDFPDIPDFFRTSNQEKIRKILKQSYRFALQKYMIGVNLKSCRMLNLCPSCNILGLK